MSKPLVCHSTDTAEVKVDEDADAAVIAPEKLALSLDPSEFAVDAEEPDESDTAPEEIAPRGFSLGACARMPQLLVPPEGFALVDQIRRTVYDFPGSDTLYAITDIYITGINWTRTFAETNNRPNSVTRTLPTVTRHEYTSGSGVASSLQFGAAFNGLTVEFGGEVNAFDTHETIGQRESTVVHTIEPYDRLFAYQRLYHFRTRTWFILDAWRQLWTVGTLRSYAPTEIVLKSRIRADEFVNQSTALFGQSTTYFPPVKGPDSITTHSPRRLEHCTGRCRQAIARFVAQAEAA
ncbi:hypothetical protein PLICRDRAFT_30864 [Plicaturopsis crispa FD-325 SS-3]|nr:hypothetical protein PLICRDRAFT_30864 [Plicaturopsis crispa FD-325 SS-3]